MALFDTSEMPKEAETPPAAGGKTNMRCHTVRGKRLFDVRRFNSEAALLESTPWHFQSGMTYCIISGGDCDALTFLRHVVRQQRLDFCLVSSWCYGEKFDGAILSSANVNTNPRTENTVIVCQTEIADFYKAFFDDIHPFNYKDFPNFKPWRRKWAK